MPGLSFWKQCYVSPSDVKTPLNVSNASSNSAELVLYFHSVFFLTLPFISWIFSCVFFTCQRTSWRIYRPQQQGPFFCGNVPLFIWFLGAILRPTMTTLNASCFQGVSEARQLKTVTTSLLSQEPQNRTCSLKDGDEIHINSRNGKSKEKMPTFS